MLRQIPGLVGWRYIRVRKGSKRPQGTGWQHPQDQTAYVKAEWPGNWGILCGHGDGAGQYLLCIDVDVKSGVDGLSKYRQLGLPETYWKETPSGGRHYLFWVPLDFVPFKVHGLGLEMLGKGQQFLAPGSVVDGKEYPDGNDHKIADLSFGRLGPIDSLRKRPHEIDDRELEQGNRNNALFLRACAAREVDGLGDDEIRELLDVTNLSLDNPLPLAEVRAIYKSVCKYPPGSPVEPLPAPEPEPDDWPPNVTRDTWAARLDKLPPRIPLIGPLKTSMVGIMYADAGVGKSMFALHLAHAISKGDGLGEWTGSGRECKALIIDGEMYSRDIDTRLKMLDGWDLEFQLSEDWPDGGLNLADPLHHPLFYRMAGDARFIIVDNVVSVTAPVDESLDYFAPQIWMGTAPLRSWARKTNRHILWIDHANRAGKLQGTQAKERDIDYLVKLTRTGELSEALKFKAEFLKYRGDAGVDVIKSEWTLGEYGFGGEIYKDWRALVKTWKRENSHLVGQRGAQARCAKDLGCARQQVNRYW